MIFDHIGLFVADLAIGQQKLSALLPIASVSDSIDDAGLKVRVQFCTDTCGIRYELVAPFGEGNPVSGVLENGKAVLNHVAYRVADLKTDPAAATKASSPPERARRVPWHLTSVPAESNRPRSSSH